MTKAERTTSEMWTTRPTKGTSPDPSSLNQLPRLRFAIHPVLVLSTVGRVVVSNISH